MTQPWSAPPHHGTEGRPGRRPLLVTGASGFLGRHVLAAVEKAGTEVISIEHRWRDVHDLSRQIGDRPIGSCIHLGWYTGPSDYLVANEPNLRSLQDSIALIQLLGTQGCEHLVIAGTSAEYAPQNSPVVEEAPIRPWSVYGAAKAALSTLLDSSWRPPGMGVAWARQFNMTGPGEKRERLIPQVARALLTGEAIDLSPGDQVRDFLDVRDVAAALVQLSASRADGKFNVSSGRGIPLKELLTRLGGLLDGGGLLRFGARDYATHDSRYLVGDNHRLCETTGWAPKIGVDEMLEDVATYWRVRSGPGEPDSAH